jgi:hypothetical protein
MRAVTAIVALRNVYPIDPQPPSVGLHIGLGDGKFQDIVETEIGDREDTKVDDPVRSSHRHRDKEWVCPVDMLSLSHARD